MPNPNGYEDFVAAGKMIQTGSPLLDLMVDPKSTDELAAEVDKFSSAYGRIRLGLSRTCQATGFAQAANSAVGWQSLSFPDIQSIRAAARALSREAELARQQGRYRDAADISIDTIRLGQAVTRGGLFVDYLVGIAIEAIGQWSLYPAIAHLEAGAGREVIAQLERTDVSREPLADVRARDRMWSENAYGWYGHFGLVLGDLSTSHDETDAAIERWALPKTQAAHRLLAAELALRQFQVAEGSLPQRLEELVPTYLAQLPIDPFDPDLRPLRYVPTADGYLAYSVGYDGDDDGGRPSSRDSGLLDDGDLTLEAYFAQVNGETAPVVEPARADLRTEEPSTGDADK